MGDDFSEGWVEFEELVNNLRSEHNLSKKDLEEYFKMYLEQSD